MNYPMVMAPFVRDAWNGDLKDEIAFWREFEIRRMASRVDHRWFAPRPHMRFGYAGFFKVRSVRLDGRRQRQLVARFNIYPMLVFSLPQKAWEQPHDADIPFSPYFNPLWYANERSAFGRYPLHLFMVDGIRYMMTVYPIAPREEVNLYYGRIDNRSWKVYHITQKQKNHANYMMRKQDRSWPLPSIIGLNNHVIDWAYNGSLAAMVAADDDVIIIE